MPTDNRTLVPKLVRLCIVGDVSDVVAYISELPVLVAMYVIAAVSDELHALLEEEDPDGLVLESFLDALADQEGVDSYVI